MNKTLAPMESASVELDSMVRLAMCEILTFEALKADASRVATFPAPTIDIAVFNLITTQR